MRAPDREAGRADHFRSARPGPRSTTLCPLGFGGPPDCGSESWTGFKCMRLQARHSCWILGGRSLAGLWKERRMGARRAVGSNSISDAEQLLCLLMTAAQVESSTGPAPTRTDEPTAWSTRAPDGHRHRISRHHRILNGLFREVHREGCAGLPGAATTSWRQRTMRVVPRATPRSRSSTVRPVDHAGDRHRSASSGSSGARYDVTAPRGSRSTSSRRRPACGSAPRRMIGLLRSFSSTSSRSTPDEGGNRLGTTVNQSAQPRRSVVATHLEQAAADHREFPRGAHRFPAEPATWSCRDRLFECGWSWSVVRDAPEIETREGRRAAGRRRRGQAYSTAP